MRYAWALLLVCATALAQEAPTAANPAIRTAFRVRYVAEDAVYIDGGRSAGLAEGMTLVIRQKAGTQAAGSDNSDAALAAELRVVSLAETSAVCQVVKASRPLLEGDEVTLPQAEVETLVERRALSNTRDYPAVISFTEGDPLDEEAREEVPRPPLPEINMARGRIGFDYSGMSSSGQASSSNLGVVLRADITRINGTYWNLSGYWRGRLDSRSAPAQQGIQDLINRTYHLTLTWANPKSRYVAGFGRMYLPWASSLETIDGGYFGRRVSDRAVLGIFGGSTPDPTSWSYDPNRRIAGGFVAVEGGDFQKTHYTSSFGMGVSAIGWRIDRPFFFAENSVSYQRVFSLYHAVQVDQPHTGPGVPPVTAGISRSTLTVRVQPHPKFEFDINHNYFRDVPTYDPQLVGTGLLDKYLFQGISVGTRWQLPRHLEFYSNVGRSNRSGDAKASWNTLFGVAANRVWRTGLRADFRYAKFDSAFAQGSYRSVTLSRNLGDQLRGEVQLGEQRYLSGVTRDTGSRFVNSRLEWFMGAHYFLEGGFTVQHGALQNYTQWYTSFGYRFDNRGKKKEAAGAAYP